MIVDPGPEPTKVLLYSAGQDSWCLRHLWKPDVCLYVDMGTEYTALERDRLDPGVDIAALPLDRWELPDKIIPLRNLMLVCLAAQYGGNDGRVQVALAATAGDRPRDKGDEFAERATDLLTWLWGPQRWTTGKEVEVVLPAKHLSKAGLVREYVAAGGDVDALRDRSVSCYTPTAGQPCGACKACARRWVAFAANGIPSRPDCRAYVTQHVLPGILAGADDREGENADVLTALGLEPASAYA